MVIQIATWISEMLIFGIAGCIWLALIGLSVLLLGHIVERVREWITNE
jgi:hypothetical protein